MHNFREGLKVVQNTKENSEKANKIDAYRTFVNQAMPGYIGLMEAINGAIKKLEKDGIIGKTKLRTRVKSVNSSLVNTEEKALDDIFGFEIVTPNEKDKEILMLIVYNLFNEKYIKQKNHNKSNGYFAHHCVGAIKNELKGTEVLELEKHILEAETDELKESYRDLSREEQKRFKRSEIFGKKFRYPVLRQEILENGQLDAKLKEAFAEAMSFIEQYFNENKIAKKSMPVVEMQFKTEAVEHEIKHGKAQHVKYKNVKEQDIVQAYLDRKLVRGVNFPFIFVRNSEGDLEIEHTSETLINMWPFIEDTVVEYQQIHSCPVANYDLYFAKVFEDLGPYVQRNLTKEPSIPVGSDDETITWSILRNKIINGSFTLPDSDKVINVVERI